MPSTIMAPRSKIPTLKMRSGAALNRPVKPAAVDEPLTAGPSSKKRGPGALASASNPRTSPNPKARKILRTEVANEHPKRPRASSPPPPSSARKRPRKSNHPPDFDYVPEAQVTPPPRRTTRHSLAAQQQQENVEEEDPMDCLTGPGALDTSGDSPQPPARARSATGFDFSLNGSRLMDGVDQDISSGGLYSDLDENENERAETSIARMAGMDQPGASPPSRSRVSVGSARHSSTTPHQVSRSSNTSRRQSKSPNVSRRTSTATACQKSVTPRRQSIASTSRRQSTTPTPRRRTEPKTLPPPVVTLTAAQARKEARLAAAQAEAEARLRESLESDLGGLSVVGEEDEEEAVEYGAREAEEGEEQVASEGENTNVGGPDNGGDWGEESDDPLASAPIFQSPTQSTRADTSTVVTTPLWKTTPGNRSGIDADSAKKGRRPTPRRQSSATNRSRWTPRSSGKRSTGAESQVEEEDEELQENDTSHISSRTRASAAISRRSSLGNTPTTVRGSANKSTRKEAQNEEGVASTPRGRNTTVSGSTSRRGSSTGLRTRSASRTRIEADSRRQSRGSPVGRGRQSMVGSTPQRHMSKSASRERSSIRNSGNGSTLATTSPMRLEVVLPAPRRSNLGGRPQQSAVSEQEYSRVTQQPTPDPSSLDHSPGLVESLGHPGQGSSSVDHTYQPSSELDREERPQDELPHFRVSTLADETRMGDGSASHLSAQEKSERSRRSSGSKSSRTIEITRDRPILEDETFGGGLDELEHDQSVSLDAVTPRVAFDSTARTFEFTPGSELRSGFGRIGSHAQSTPYVRGSFGRPSQGGESSLMHAGPLDLELGQDLSNTLGDMVPYAAQGEATGNESRSLQQSYRAVSVDSSVAISMGSPEKSLRTERLPTPRPARVALFSGSDDEQDDGPPSPSAGRQSFGDSINGRNLSEILKMRKQAKGQSDLSAVEMTTRLDDTAQEVLRGSSTRSGRGGDWSQASTSRTSVARPDLNDGSKPLVIPRLEEVSSDGEADIESEPEPASDHEDERIVRGSVLEDHPFDKYSIHLPRSDEPGVNGVQDYDASVHFEGPPRAPIRRSATPILRGRHLAESDDEQGQQSKVHRDRSTSGSDDSSEPDDGAEELEFEGEGGGQHEQSPARSALGVTKGKNTMARAGYLAEGDSVRYAPSPSSSARSTSRSLSRPRERYSSYFAGDRTSGLSRSQMMIEASRYEDWEPPARRKLKPRPWTDHDWRMLAHYLRRVQKSQALAKGLTSREELDLMVVNVHAVVDRFVEEEAHGIKLEGDWARSEITGRAVYLIIKERHKQDGTWKTQALSDPSFSAILADMTRPRDMTDGPDETEDFSEERMLPAALVELPAPSRAAAANLLGRTPTTNDTTGHPSEPSLEDDEEEEEEEEEEEAEEAPAQSTRIVQGIFRAQRPSSKASPRRSPKRGPRHSPRRQNAPIIVAHQRVQELQGTHNSFTSTTSSDSSNLQADQSEASGPSTTMYSRLIGSLSSIIGGRSQAETTGTSMGFPKLKPVSHVAIDLTHIDDELSFPTLNHVPTPARPTPARPKRQKRVEPKLDIPPLQHVSPPRPAEPSRVLKKKAIRRAASVRELAKTFEQIGEKNRREAEAARSRVGYGRSVSGPAALGRFAVSEFARPAPSEPSTSNSRLLKDSMEVIEISDSSLTARDSVEL